MTTYFSNDSSAPTPNRIHAGGVLAIYHEERVLLDLRRDGGWGLIGGALEIGESLVECAKREAQEETGLKINELDLLGIFSQPDRIISRFGESVQLLTTCFATHISEPKLRISNESQQLQFFSRAELDSLDIVPTHQVIIPYLFEREAWPVMS